MFTRLLLLLCSIPLTCQATAQPCTPDATQQAAAQTLKLQQQLLAVPIRWNDSVLQPPLRANLREFKQSLVRTIDTGLRCNNPEPARVGTDFAVLLHANQPQKPDRPVTDDDFEKPQKDIYGNNLRVAVKPLPERPGLLGIQLTYSIQCSDDNILLVYRRSASGWQKELVWQNPDVGGISDAFGDFFLFTIVPTDPSRPYSIAVAYGFPWCTSTYSKFRVDLLSPAIEGKPQALVSHIEQSYRREDDERIKATSDGFEIRSSTNDLAMQDNVRNGVFRYRTTAGKLERVQPIANNARDFVDEWLQIPWSEAAQWSALPLSALKSVHDRFDYRLHPATNSGDGTPTIDAYGPVRACASAERRFQIEIDLSDVSPSAPSSKLYAIVAQSPAAFTMLSINPQPDPACHGPDIMLHH